MESETIKNQLVVLFNNLKNIQPNERDNLITFMKKTLSQLQGDDERDNLYQNSNMNSDNYAYCCSGNAGDTTNNSSITNNSSTYQVHLKPSELYDLTSTNVDCLQLSSDATADSAPVEEVNNFSTLTTIHHHHNPTSLGDHDFSSLLDNVFH
uniref:Zinc finger, C2H2-type domain-containing protein n=1 Tax=Schistosoma japonicum TaxID=6182 RepID=C1LFS8_SCHJA|nr:Zinc finger, C2H2-type domain-containing protein [Schistosoma japonicum]